MGDGVYELELLTQKVMAEAGMGHDFILNNGRYYAKMYKNVDRGKGFLQFSPDEFVVVSKAGVDTIKFKIELYSYNETLIEFRDFDLTADVTEMVKHILQILNMPSIICEGVEATSQSVSDINEILIESYKGKVIYRSTKCPRLIRMVKQETGQQANICTHCLKLPLIKCEEIDISNNDLKGNMISEEVEDVKYFFREINAEKNGESNYYRFAQEMTEELNDGLDFSDDNDADYKADDRDDDSDEEFVVKEEVKKSETKKKRGPKIKKEKKIKSEFDEGMEKKVYKCTDCDKEFDKRKIFTEHKKSHEGSINCPKPGCEEKFGSMWNMKMRRHMNQFHKWDADLDISCGACEAKFNSYCDYKRHNTVTHVRKSEKSSEPSTCEVCGKQFQLKQTMVAHMKVHLEGSALKPIKCVVDSCDKTFRNKTILNEHLSAVHLNEKRYVCSGCGKAFRYRAKRNDCERRHKGNYNFKCQLCPKAFRDRMRLQYHIFVHTGEKPWHCPMCTFRCARPDNLNLHCKKLHKVTYHEAEKITGKCAKVKSESSINLESVLTSATIKELNEFDESKEPNKVETGLNIV